MTHNKTEDKEIRAGGKKFVNILMHHLLSQYYLFEVMFLASQLFDPLLV